MANECRGKLRPAQRVNLFKADVWSLFNRLTDEFKAVNMGQGFMGFPAPQFIKDEACRSVQNDFNQYSNPRGTPRIRKALSTAYRSILGRQLDVDSEIIVTAGANEGIYCVLCAFLEKGDEVLLIEPYFDQYLAYITLNDAVPVYCPLRPPDSFNSQPVSSSEWKLDMEELESKISPRTKMIILNTPHNPVGKVFTSEELVAIGRLAKKHDLLIVSDEVYDRLYYAGSQHVSIASLEDFWERTVTVGSAGKSFGVTGWRVGWVMGPKQFVDLTLSAHTRIVFCTNTPLQTAVGEILVKCESNGFFEQQRKDYEQRMRKFIGVFDELKLPYTAPQGSYFLLVNTKPLNIPPTGYDYPQEIVNGGNCYKACYFFIKEIGVSAIPVSEFYSDENCHQADGLIRFAFCKSNDVLDEAVKRLRKLKDFLN